MSGRQIKLIPFVIQTPTSPKKKNGGPFVEKNSLYQADANEARQYD